MTQTEALRLALEALETIALPKNAHPIFEQAITAIKAALEAKDEPVAWINVEKRTFEWNGPVLWETPTIAVLDKIPLYTTPPQRKPLTDEQINDIAKNYALNNPTTPLHFARAIEAKLKEKNT